MKVPSFSCSQGVVVPKVFDAMGHCEYPEDLRSTCVENSRLGRLTPQGSDVDIIFSCRNVATGDVDNDAPVTYNDVAVIQHDNTTGATCFYQHLENTDGENIPSPTEDRNQSFWNIQVENCAMCHTNGAFVRTPHYWDVKDAQNIHILPAKPVGDAEEPYSIINQTPFQVAIVEKEDNACTTCHQVGAYRRGSGQAWKIGNVNQLASGQWDNPWSAVRRNGDTMNGTSHDGYDDFMADHVQGGRTAAVKAVQELEGCLSQPTPEGCTLTHTYTEPYARADGKGGVRFQVRNLNIMGQGMDASLAALPVGVPTIALATIEYNYQCDNCGTTINQIIIGFEGAEKASACIYSGPGNSGGWKFTAVDLSQPFGVTMNKRDIRVRYAQAFNCEDALDWWNIDGNNGPDANHSIGSLTVKFP